MSSGHDIGRHDLIYHELIRFMITRCRGCGARRGWSHSPDCKSGKDFTTQPLLVGCSDCGVYKRMGPSYNCVEQSFHAAPPGDA